MTCEVLKLHGGNSLQITQPRLKSLYGLWDGQRQGVSMPDWHNFDILEMGAWIGYLSLLEVIPQPLDLIYRVFSTNVSVNLRRDLTGRRLSESEGDVPRDVRDCYFEVISSCQPRLQLIDDVSNDGQSVVFERLVLPLSSDGQNVNMILVGY